MSKYFDWDKIKEEAPDQCKGCDSLEDAIKSCNELDALFNLWKAAHTFELDAIKNADDAEKSTFPDLRKYKTKSVKTAVKDKYCEMEDLRKDICINFCRDSFIEGSETDYNKPKVLLFVFREANISDDVQVCENGYIGLNNQDNFWLSEKYRDTSNQGKSNNYMKFIRQYAALSTLQKGEARIAVINLNKRGGFGSCNSSRLQHYVVKYKAFIQKEIEIINPSIIICGGTFGTVKDLLADKGMSDKDKTVQLWDCYHPSATAKKEVRSITKWTFLETEDVPSK